MRSRVLVIFAAITALLLGAGGFALGATAATAPNVLCAHNNDRKLAEFSGTCPTGYFRVQLAASDVAGGGVSAVGAPGAKGDTGPAGPVGAQGPAGKDGGACPAGYTAKDILSATTTTAAEADQAAWVKASADYAVAKSAYVDAVAAEKVTAAALQVAKDADATAKGSDKVTTAAALVAAQKAEDTAAALVKSTGVTLAAATKTWQAAEYAALGAVGLVTIHACVKN